MSGPQLPPKPSTGGIDDNEWDWEEDTRLEWLEGLSRHRYIQKHAQEQGQSLSAFRAANARQSITPNRAFTEEQEKAWRWRQLEAGGCSQLSADSIPWPPDEGDILEATARLALQQDQHHGSKHVRGGVMLKEVTEAAYKKAFRYLSLRWHPDKFWAKYGADVPEGGQAAVLERVCTVFGRVSAQWQQHVEDAA